MSSKTRCVGWSILLGNIIGPYCTNAYVTADIYLNLPADNTVIIDEECQNSNALVNFRLYLDNILPDLWIRYRGTPRLSDLSSLGFSLRPFKKSVNYEICKSWKPAWNCKIRRAISVTDCYCQVVGSLLFDVKIGNNIKAIQTSVGTCRTCFDNALCYYFLFDFSGNVIKPYEINTRSFQGRKKQYKSATDLLLAIKKIRYHRNALT